MIRMVSLFAHLTRRASVEICHDVVVDEVERQEQAAGYLAFADHVLDTFVETHQPLKGTPHHNLTSLARAYMILGRFSKGFEVLQLILQRRDVRPDMADINVSLSFLAEQSPQAAVKMLDQMVDRGLLPDKITIGTIVHWGLIHGDLPLVSAILERASQMPNGQRYRTTGIPISPETTAALSRALANPDTPLDPDSAIGSRQQRKDRLEAAYSILSNMERSPNVAMSHIGKTLVLSSLKASEAIMAYRFWKLLLRNYEDWQDREQLFIRRIILDAMRRSKPVWELPQERRRKMVAELSRTSVPGSKMRRRDDGQGVSDSS